MKFYVYAIKNESSGKIYIGHSADLQNRLARHNHQLPNKATSFASRNQGHWVLVYQESFSTRAEAIIREKKLKSFRGREFLKSKINNRP